MSPIFPYITDFKAIIEESKDFIDEYWFENLNLRGQYKVDILSYIHEKYPHYEEGYHQIYNKKNNAYWEQLALEIHTYCMDHKIKFINYFYHSTLVKEKLALEKQKKQKSQP